MGAIKVVLTGGPSSGKSSLIRELEKRGHQVMHEVARQVLEERRDRNLDREEWEIRQKLIYNAQVSEEAKYSGLVFLDRGVLDGVAYSMHFLGEVPFNFIAPNYYMVFNLERLAFVNDGLRIENGEEEAQEIHQKIISTYKKHGYPLLSIPILKAPTIEESISRRTEYLLSKLGPKASNLQARTSNL